MKVDRLEIGMRVWWGRSQSGTVLGWVDARPEGQRRGRGDLVLVRLADAPEFSFIWDREGRYTRRLPVKALHAGERPAARPLAPGLWGAVRADTGPDTARRRKTITTAAALAAEVTRRVDALRATPGRLFPCSAEARVEAGGRRVTLSLSAQDATALLAALRGLATTRGSTAVGQCDGRVSTPEVSTVRAGAAAGSVASGPFGGARGRAREDGTMTGETVAPSQALWDAVNAYASACGGDTGDATISGSRMDAVAAVERAVAGLVQERLEEAARVTLVDLAEANDVTRKLLAREGARLVPENMRAEVVRALRRGASALAEAEKAELAEVDDDFGCGHALCEVCEREPDPRDEWKQAGEECSALAERLEASAPVPSVALEVARRELDASAAELRERLKSWITDDTFEFRPKPAVNFVPQDSILHDGPGGLFEPRAFTDEDRRFWANLPKSPIPPTPEEIAQDARTAAEYMLGAADAIEAEAGDIDGECWEARRVADENLGRVALFLGEVYEAPDRGPDPAARLGGNDDDEEED